MEKKLSELWIEHKCYVNQDAMSVRNVLVYGDIKTLEEKLFNSEDQGEDKYFKGKLKKIAQEHGIKDYKL